VEKSSLLSEPFENNFSEFFSKISLLIFQSFSKLSKNVEYKFSFEFCCTKGSNLPGNINRSVFLKFPTFTLGGMKGDISDEPLGA
jgi:hypothetical protein